MDLLKMKTFSLFCLLCNTISCERVEHRCSKFDYDERLLHKLVTLEFQFQQVVKEFEQMNKEVVAERKLIEKERESMKEQVERTIEESSKKLNTLDDSIKTLSADLRTSQNETIRDLENNVKDMGEKLVKDVNDATMAMEVTHQQNEAKLMRLSGDLRTFQNETIHNLTSTLTTPDVFFMARLTGGTLSLSTNKKFVFETVQEDRRGGYNNNDGTFTVPVDGQYLFETQVCNSSNKYVYFAITVDDVRKKVAVVSRNIGFTCTTATLISRVKTGTRVAVQSTGSSKAFCTSSNYGCYFSGYLLKQTPD